MPRFSCLRPSLVYRVENAEGPACFVYDEAVAAKGLSYSPVYRPCSKCLACQHNRGMDWGNRLWLEARNLERACMLSLTYDPAHLPLAPSTRDCQLFIKRLRMWCERRGLGKLRYFLVAEFGGLNGRIHYHCIILGQDFLEFGERVSAGDPDSMIVCDEVSRLWGKGHVDIRPMIRERCMYVAMHAVKAFHTDHTMTMRPLYSRKPAIAFEFVDAYLDDLVRLGFFTDGQGQRAAVPRHFLKWDSHKHAFKPLVAKRREHVESMTAESMREAARGNAVRIANFEEQLRLKALEKGNLGKRFRVLSSV